MWFYIKIPLLWNGKFSTMATDVTQEKFTCNIFAVEARIKLFCNDRLIENYSNSVNCMTKNPEGKLGFKKIFCETLWIRYIKNTVYVKINVNFFGSILNKKIMQVCICLVIVNDLWVKNVLIFELFLSVKKFYFSDAPVYQLIYIFLLRFHFNLIL